MKHLKLFEEHSSVKDTFKDKINWKLFNFIEATMQKLNDKGSNLHIEILIPSTGLTMSSGYVIYTNENEVEVPPEDYEGEYGDYEYQHSNGYIEHKNLDHLIKLYNKNGLIYTINMTGKNKYDADEVMSDVLDKIIEMVKTKFDIGVYKFDAGLNFHHKPLLTYNIKLK